MAPDQIFNGILLYCVLLFSLVFHEFGHAWTALRCGDDTAKQMGRVTLNPVAHMDPIGTVVFPLLQIFSGVPLIGWARPVPFDRRKLRHPGRDDVLVALAGPGFNLILAFTASLLMRFNSLFLGGVQSGIAATIYEFAHATLPLFQYINVLLAVFNLIPMPPLDGSYLVNHFLPEPLAARYRSFGMRWGFIVVLVLLYTGVARQFIGFGAALLSPVLNALSGS